MGSSNFANSFYHSIGMVMDYDISDEWIEDYRVTCLEECENDPDDINYRSDDEIIELMNEYRQDVISESYDYTEKLVDILNEYMDYERVNPLAKFGLIPITFELESGYHDGFRIVIESECVWRDEYILEKYYEDNLGSDDDQYSDCLPKGMTFEQFKNCYDKAEAFAEYVMCELTKHIPLTGIAGGWCGGIYELDEPSESDHKRFSELFTFLLKDMKDAKLGYY